MLKVFLLSTLAISFPFPKWSAGNQKEKDDEEVAMAIGTAKKGGISFQYQSAKRKEQCIYRVRNSPKGVFTPLRWKDKDGAGGIFIECNLPKCPHENDPCEWIEASITTVEIGKGLSSIGYGTNRDEFTDEPDAFKRKKKEERRNDAEREKAEYPPFRTTVKGTFAINDEKNVTIELEVSSSVAAANLVYGFKSGKNDEVIRLKTGEGRLQPEKGVALEWESIDMKKVLEHEKDNLLNAARERKIKIGTEGQKPIVKEKLLKLSYDGKVFVSLTAPAYTTPKDE